MLPLLMALTLTQVQPAVKRTTPAADDPGMVVRQVGTVNVNCTSGCSGSGSGWTPDGGNIGIVNQGTGFDGGTTWSVDVARVGGTNVTTGSGASSTGTQRVILATDQPVIPISDNGGSITVDGTVADTQSGAWTVSTTPPSNASTNVSQFGGSNVVTGTGASGAGIPRVTVSNDSTVTANAGTGTFTVGQSTASNLRAQTSSESNTGLAVPTQASMVGGSDGTNLRALRTATDGTVRVDPTGTTTQPVSGTVSLSGTSSVNVAQVNGNTVNTGNGTAGTGTQRVTIASDNTAFTVNAAQSGTWNINNVSGTVSLPTGAATETTLGTRLADSTFTGRFAASAALADATSNPSVTSIGSYLMGYNGTTWDRLRNSTANGLLVDVSRIAAGTNYIGKTRITDGTLDVSLLNSAPGSDTGQVSVPVRIISSLAGGAGGTSSSYGSAFPASGTAAGFSDGTNMQGARVFDADTGGGTQYVLGANLRVSASGGSSEAAAGAGTTNASTLRVVLPTDQTSIPVTDNGSSLTVDGTVAVSSVGGTVTVSGTVDTELPAAAALADATSNPTTTSVGALGLLYNGTTWDRMRGDTTNGLLVNVSDSFLLDSTFTGRFSAAAAAADNFANPTTTGVLGFNMVWDGATWDRAPGTSVDGTLVNLGANNDVTVTSGNITADTELPTAAALADATANPTTTSVGALGLMYNGTTWDRMRGTTSAGLLVDVSDTFLLDATFTGRFMAAAALADNTANPTTTGVAAFGMVWDGATWDRLPGTSAAGLTTNHAFLAGNAVSTGVGASGTGTQRVASLIHDGTTTAGVIAATTALKTDVSSIAGTATSTGNGVAGAGVQRVTIASDNTAFTVNAAQSGTWTVQPGNTANTTAWLVNAGQVASANNDGACVSVSISTTVLASNASRRQAAIMARMSNTDTVFIKFAATATTSDFPLEPGQVYNLDGDARVYTGVIDAIANSGTQSVCVTEFN